VKGAWASPLRHDAHEPVDRFVPELSRWGHGGVYAHYCDDKPPGRYPYWWDGPFQLAEIDDDTTGSFHILQGHGHDAEFNALLDVLGPQAGLGARPFLVPQGQFGVEYFRELHRLLREQLEAEGYEGWWMGGEVVVWNYAKMDALPA
jgi:hypothetical protein